MAPLVSSTVDIMRQAYPELAESEDAIVTMVTREEEQFRRTLRAGHQLLDEALGGMHAGETLTGDTAFKLHDTFGFPLELTEEIVAERGYQIDLADFDRMMEDQKTRARAAFRGADTVAAADAYRTLLDGVQPTRFVGYEKESSNGRVLSIISDGESIESATEGQPVELFLDRTPFYAESGGQIGDAGRMVSPTGTVQVADTQFALPGLHGHRGTVAKGTVSVGQEVALSIKRERRERIRKNHTGTHLLHYALREVVGDHVHQAGSLVADDRLRFDFTHFAGLEPQELRDLELLTNERVIENAQVTTVETTKEKAEEMGAIAFFGDKYGDEVRVVQAGDYSSEFCGGTHVPSTGQIGPLIVISEGSVAANTRRVEAVTGTAAYEYMAGLRRDLEEAAGALGAQPSRLVEAARAMALNSKGMAERIEQFEQEARTSAAGELLDQVEHVGEHSVLVAKQERLTGDELRALAFQVRDRVPSGIGVLGSEVDGKGAIIAFVSDDLVEEGVSAGEVIAQAARILGGGGSRDPRLAQAGGPEGSRINEALDEAREAARAAVHRS
jgi:alanyl-tRNA synthetase